MIPFVQKSCQGCTDRVIGCHSTCERYKRDREIHDAIVSKSREGRDADEYLMDRVAKCCDREALRKKL